MLRAFEKSPKGRWHVHGVAVRYIDVSKIRKHAQKYGFGRVNVKVIPAAKALYPVKYLLKNRRSLEAKGCRLMACVGFKGLTADRVEVVNGYRDWVYGLTNHLRSDGQRSYPFRYRENEALKLWCHSLNQGRTSIKEMKLNPKQLEQINACFARGEIALPVEYRGGVVTSGQFASFDDPDIKVWKVTVTHSCEGVNGSQIVLVEYLPEAEGPEECKKQAEAAEKGIQWKQGDHLIAKLRTLQVAKGMRKGAVSSFERLIP